MNEEWDERHEAAIYHWDTTAEIELPHLDRQRHVIAPDQSKDEQLEIQSLLLPRDSSDLIVILHGAFSRDEITPPRFEWLRTLSAIRSENLLFIADTTLVLDDRLSLAWYIGTEKDNLTARIAQYIQKVAQLRDIKRVVLMGSSGGGFAALAIGHRIPGSLAIAVSPQSSVREYLDWTYAYLHRVVFPQFPSFEEAEASDLSRFDMMELYKKPAAEGARFWYVQNLGDTFHVDNHYIPFAESLGLTADGGVTADGTGYFTVDDWGPGHRGPESPQLRRMLDDAFSGAFALTR